jgi:predicted small lipoprotein YifL
LDLQTAPAETENRDLNELRIALRLALLAGLLGMLLAACGQRGPLYLPPAEDAPASGQQGADDNDEDDGKDDEETA